MREFEGKNEPPFPRRSAGVSLKGISVGVIGAAGSIFPPAFCRGVVEGGSRKTPGARRARPFPRRSAGVSLKVFATKWVRSLRLALSPGVLPGCR